MRTESNTCENLFSKDFTGHDIHSHKSFIKKIKLVKNVLSTWSNL
jgi:hypothetical protein